MDMKSFKWCLPYPQWSIPVKTRAWRVIDVGLSEFCFSYLLHNSLIMPYWPDCHANVDVLEDMELMQYS